MKRDNMRTPLQKAVLRQLGGGTEAIESAKDAARHGADAGFPGFTYYKDTLSFTHRYRSEIAEAVAELARDLGETPIGFVRGFRCLDKSIPEQAIAVSLYGGRTPKSIEYDLMQVENALAWFALEEVGRALENE
jgi:hypothetical protein